jgi:hypothetical protein
MKLSRKIAAAVIAGSLACSSPQPRDSIASVPASPTDRRLVGLLRSDGVVVPFAEQVAGQWTLPGMTAPRDGAPDLADAPAAWFASGSTTPSWWLFVTLTGRAGTLTTSKTLQARSHCQSIWALASDLPAIPLKETEVHTAAGVAATGDTTLEPFVTLPNDSGEARRIVAWLKSAFDRDEEAAAKAAPDRNPRAPAASDRERLPIAIERIVRSKSAVGGRALYYIEAVRHLPTNARGSRDDCGLQSFWTGWLSEVPATGELAILTSRLDLTDCDRKGSSSTIPLALLRSGGDTVVVAIDRFWESEQYAMYVTDGKTMRALVRAGGGGC